MAPPRRSGGNQWIGARASRGAMAITFTLAAAFVVLVCLREPARIWIAQHLALIPRRALGPEAWQIATAGLFSIGLGKLVSSGIGVWIFGTAVEEQAGRARMLIGFFSAQIFGMLAVAVIGRWLAPDGEPEQFLHNAYAGFSGASPGVCGLIAAFGVYYGPIPLRFFGIVEMRGRTMALIVLGLSFGTGLINRDFVMLAGDVVGAATGWGFASGAGERISLAWERWKLWRLRRRYKVIPGGRDTKRYLN
jgi:membrane associated rhomboid family serine protease